MSLRTTKPAIIDVDMTTVGEVLERARLALPHEDHACLESLVDTFIELSRLVRERGTTIARLRRLFGLASSEKTRDVLADAPPAPEKQDSSQPEASSETDSSAAETDGGAPSNTPPPDSAQNGAADADEKPKRIRKGHGRIGASQYALARPISVEHERLRIGDLCPCCAHGKLHRLRKPARIVRREMEVGDQQRLEADVDRRRPGHASSMP